MSTRPKRPPADPREELRELTAGAHAAIKDLRQLLAEIRQVTAAGAREAYESAGKAADKAIDEFNVTLQNEMNRHSANLNVAVNRARQHIVAGLSVSRLERQDNGKFQVIFQQNGNQLFDEDPALHPGPGRAPGPAA